MSWVERWKRSRRGECRVCGVALAEERLADCVGRCGGVRISFDSLPVRACPSSHERRYIHPEFGSALTDALFHSSGVPVSRTRTRDRHRCRACGGRLSNPGIGAVHVRGSIEILDLPPFGVELSGPGTCCPGCGQVQIYATRESSDKIAEAMVDAFRSVGLKP